MTKYTVHKVTDGAGEVKGWSVIRDRMMLVAEFATVEEACAYAKELNEA